MALVVSIVRKVDQSECLRLQSHEKKRKKTAHCNSRALFTRKAPTKKEVVSFELDAFQSKTQLPNYNRSVSGIE